MLLQVHADPSIDPSKFHLLSMTVFGGGVTLTFGYNGVQVGAVTIESASFVRYGLYFFTCTGVLFDTVGKIVVGSLANVMKLSGSYNFTLAAGRLSPTVVRPDVRGVTAIYLKNGTDMSGPIQGDIVLQAGRNFFSSFIQGDETPANPSRITLNAIDGQGLNTPCECDEAANLPCIKTIDGIGPDEEGRFTLLESECIKLNEIANGLQLVNECSKPCCGCEELDIVRETMERVTMQVNSLENLASRLEAAISTLQINLLQSNARIL
jgi:hypothetical protein